MRTDAERILAMNKSTDKFNRVPVVFASHGYPMNAIGNNKARPGWHAMGEYIGRPEAIVAITSHWETPGICIRTALDNPQLFDVWDLPDEIHNLHYAPAGSEAHIKRVMELLGGEALPDNTWGTDHALWTTLSNMYPGGDVPLVILNTDDEMPVKDIYRLGQRLSPLRDEGVLIFTTGNIAHNVDMVDHSMECGFEWAVRFDTRVRDMVLAGDIAGVMDYKSIPDWETAIPMPSHYLTLIAAMGAAGQDYKVSVWNDYVELGSLSMTSYIFE